MSSSYQSSSTTRDRSRSPDRRTNYSSSGTRDRDRSRSRERTDRRHDYGNPKRDNEDTRYNDEPKGPKLFVGNLSFDVTNDNLEEHFKKYGATYVHIVTDPFTGGSITCHLLFLLRVLLLFPFLLSLGSSPLFSATSPALLCLPCSPLSLSVQNSALQLFLCSSASFVS